MRVHEYSKLVGVSSKELLEFLRSAGFEVSSPMSALDEECMQYFEKHREAHSSSIDEETASSAEKGADAPALVARPMSVGDLAGVMDKPVSELILFLLKQGIVCNKNQVLSQEMVERVARYHGLAVVEQSDALVEEDKDQDLSVSEHRQQTRPAIIVVMGHVDHGKTTLLDFIRKTRVALREKGGITQHLGAYTVPTHYGDVVFLDTPGHAAFNAMRQRGAKVADIAILVVAADDGVKPQTIEAIKVAQNVDMPIVVAINKADRVDAARIEEVKAELSRHGVLLEEWGGDAICVSVSAKTGAGVDELLEFLAIKSQEMDLRADYDAPAQGYVLEATLERGRGPVATFIARHGQVRVGDYFVCGDTVGRVNALIDSEGKPHRVMPPAVPVRIVGFSVLPQAGDYLRVVAEEEYRKMRAQGPQRQVSPTQASQGEAKPTSILVSIKADCDSSREALLQSMVESAHKVGGAVRIFASGVGDISEGDVDQAADAGAILYGFGVKIDRNAVVAARRTGVEIRNFGIIYQLLDDLVALIKSKREVKVVRIKTGEALVKKVFNIKGIGVVAGCVVRKGKFVKEGYVVAKRDDKPFGEGKLRSLQRDKKSVKEVLSGFECAFFVDSITDWQEGDIAECLIEERVEA